MATSSSIWSGCHSGQLLIQCNAGKVSKNAQASGRERRMPPLRTIGYQPAWQRWPQQALHSRRLETRRCPAKVAAHAKSAPASEGPAELPKSWSNPSGAVLREVIPGVVWAAERPFVYATIDVGGRMGVVKLKDGTLWVHSPVELDEPLKAELAKIGPVRHIVSPNYEHCGYAKQWMEAYPEATGYACPGLKDEKPGFGYKETTGDGNDPPGAWGGEFSFVWVDVEKNPFTGKPFFNEVVFVHHPSKMLFTADLFWNWPGEGIPKRTWLFKQGMDRIFLPFYKTFMVTQQDHFHKLLRSILSWDFTSIMPCHGSIIFENAKDSLARHYMSPK